MLISTWFGHAWGLPVRATQSAGPVSGARPRHRGAQGALARGPATSAAGSSQPRSQPPSAGRQGTKVDSQMTSRPSVRQPARGSTGRRSSAAGARASRRAGSRAKARSMSASVFGDSISALEARPGRAVGGPARHGVDLQLGDVAPAHVDAAHLVAERPGHVGGSTRPEEQAAGVDRRDHRAARPDALAAGVHGHGATARRPRPARPARRAAARPPAARGSRPGRRPCREPPAGRADGRPVSAGHMTRAPPPCPGRPGAAGSGRPSARAPAQAVVAQVRPRQVGRPR